MGSVYTGIHEKFALQAREQYGLRAFVETGLCQGYSALWALANGFYPVISIELSRAMIRDFKQEHPDALDSIRIVHGDSRETLYGELSKLTTPALIWLDAHSVPETPVLDEIAQVFRWWDVAPNLSRSVIMIDDVRLFGVQGQWPTLQTVLNALGQRCKCIITEDVIVATNKDAVQ